MASSSDHRKLALLIDNNAYARSENRLDHSTENVEKLRDSLEKIGFHVTRASDLHKHEMTIQIIDFSQAIHNGDLVLFYFCGHGCQVNGMNYLIPISSDWIKTERDVEAFSVSFDRMLKRIVERNPSYANIFILDCCRPYLGKDPGTSGATMESKGLCEMQPIGGALIQFACAANQTVPENLFIERLLINITEENVNINDLFQRIGNDVYETSHQKQRPLLINGLKQDQDIYLNYVPPPAPMWDEVKEDEKISIENKQAQLKDQYNTFPDIGQITDPDNEDIRKAEEFTRDLLSKLPSGDVNDRHTAFHVVNKVFEDEGEQCLFFDSSQGVNLYNTFGNLADRSLESKPFILQLDSFDGLGNETNLPDELSVLKTLNRVIGENASHPVTDDIIERLARAHNVDKKYIVLKSIYHGSMDIVYGILVPSIEETSETHQDSSKAKTSIEVLQELPRNLEKQFPQFKNVKMHPLLHRPTFDVALFDELGHRNFEGLVGTYDIGPPDRTQKYIQPTAWVRHGWRVRGRYSTDTWLQPFRDPANWYRAFHGTKRAQDVDFKDPNALTESGNISLDATASIYRHGFRPARVAAYGPGVYCSPKPTFIDTNYAGTASILTEQGQKSYKFMLQVAVNPDDVKLATDDIWVVGQPENIRTYGLLIKEVESK